MEPGASYPIGATIASDGVGFSVFARQATGMDLLLFDRPEDDLPARVISYDAHTSRTGPYWHSFVPGIAAGQVYGYRAHGAWAPQTGHRFDPRHVLLDPYGRGVAVPQGYQRDLGEPTEGALGRSLKSVVVDTSAYDWAGDRPLGRPFRETIIYEAHVRGMTANPNSGVEPELRGTYAGLVTRIPYLLALGITAIELLPVFQFDRLAAPPGLVNYWGYQPISFFAPHAAYASRPGAQAVVDEFRDMVKAFHAAGIEVLLDVVFNHTAEGDHEGPAFCYRGLANDDYYTLAADRSRYADFSGTGNTLDASSSVVRRMILDSLRYWVSEMHIDGFRFDLAAVLSRDAQGEPLADPAVIRDIEDDPMLAGTKLIAEAWDAGGLYQVGSFVGDRWCEWNGRFRDDVRGFVKGDPGLVASVAQRFLASPDIYGARGHEPTRTINFATCHDGFTLNDLVSYDAKRNAANGEDSRDGSDDNRSWGCGVDGPTDDPAIERLRSRQVRNFLVIELLSMGVPMLQMGDEVRRTQGGNNNAYCQDNELSWFDWDLVERHADTLAFTALLIASRRHLDGVLGHEDGLSLVDLLAASDITFSGVHLGQPDMGQASHSLALTVRAPAGALHLILNAWWQPLEFELPGPSADLEPWRRVLDTCLDSPHDLVAFEAADAIAATSYTVGPRSTVCIAARRQPA